MNEQIPGHEKETIPELVAKLKQELENLDKGLQFIYRTGELRELHPADWMDAGTLKTQKRIKDIIEKLEQVSK